MSKKNIQLANLKVAFVRDYLTQYGGAEKTLEAMLELFPNAPIYTGVYNKGNLTPKIEGRTIFSTQNKLIVKFQKYFTFLMPLVFESFDLSQYDLIISDGQAWAKGVLTNPDQIHISYIHTPPRFLYGYSVETQKRNKWYYKPFVTVIDFCLRIWDFAASKRPDFILTNSNTTKKRIQKYYDRDATVIYPPVDIDTTNIKPNQKIKDLGKYYIVVGRLAAYKNFDLVIKAFMKMGTKLVVAGTGTEEQNLHQIAQGNKNIIFMGRVSEEDKKQLITGAMGLINAVEDEDFGIVPIEAISNGTPVFAHNSGGHLETVEPNKTGMFFNNLDIDGFIQEFKKFDDFASNNEFNHEKIQQSVQKFNKQRFQEELLNFITSKMN